MSARTISRPAERKAARPGGQAWYDLALAAGVFVGFLVSLYLAFIYAPADAVQGDVQRIFYFHVSLAWLAYLAFFVVFLGSALYLWRREARWDRLARSSAEIGVVFTTLVLVTGSIWGRPIWGTWWTWDARLTTTLILWAIYVVYLMLRAYSTDRVRGARYGAVLGILGFADVPLVQMSVVWWRTLHPGPVVSLEGGGGMPPQMLLAMTVSVVSFTLFYVYVLRQRVRIEWLKDEIEALRDEEEVG